MTDLRSTIDDLRFEARGVFNRQSSIVNRKSSGGFTLLEVLVALTVLAIGAALTLSLISACLSNIRKVQLRTRIIEHAESVMELALLDDSIQKPISFNGDFEDGTRWSVHVQDYVPSSTQPRLPASALQQQVKLPVKLLYYMVEMIGPDSRTTDYRLQTLKLVKVPADEMNMGLGR